MKLQMRASLYVLGAAMAVACGDGETDEGGEVVVIAGSLVELSTIEPGSVCESGGTLIERGTDDDGDGELDSNEVEQSINVCSGADGSGLEGPEGDSGADGAAGNDGVVTLSSVDAAVLEVCPAGGTVVSFGPDADGSGTLDEGEVSSTSTICNGPAGEDVCAPVLKVSPIGPGSSCAAGGILVEFGGDDGNVGAGGAGGAGGASAASCDGMLAETEVLGSETVCNGIEGEKGVTGEKGDPGEKGDMGDPGDQGDPGADGSDGVAGANMAVSLEIIASGAVCTSGGLQLDSGVDDNDDGILQASEIDDSVVSCF